MQLDTNYWTLHFKGIEYFILSQESKMVNLRSMVLRNLDLYGGLSLPICIAQSNYVQIPNLIYVLYLRLIILIMVGCRQRDLLVTL
jgi:hypothetical protein